MISSTGLSAVPSVSLPQLTKPAGSRLMIMAPTAVRGDPAGAITYALKSATAIPATPPTSPHSHPQAGEAPAIWVSPVGSVSACCAVCVMSPSSADGGRLTTNDALTVSRCIGP